MFMELLGKGDGIIDFGDGTIRDGEEEPLDYRSIGIINQDTEILCYEIEHTYSSPGNYFNKLF